MNYVSNKARIARIFIPALWPQQYKLIKYYVVYDRPLKGDQICPAKENSRYS